MSFLVEEVFVADEYTMVYSHIDRIIVGGIMPVAKTVPVALGKTATITLKRGLSILRIVRNACSYT